MLPPATQQSIAFGPPTLRQLTARAGNATLAAVNLHRLATTRHTDFTFASSNLTTALLASVGATNMDILRTTFPDLAPYMLTPSQIVDTMTTQHGVTTGDDVSKLLSPLSQPLMSLSDLTKRMSSFLLASQRLKRSGQGETSNKYFKMFLETVAGFPSIGMCLTTYYTGYPVIANQSVATLFPYLETMKDHLPKSDPGTPFPVRSTRQQAATAQEPANSKRKHDQPATQRQQEHSTQPSLEPTWSHSTRRHPGPCTRHHYRLRTLRR
jgi:hypothetical protein